MGHSRISTMILMLSIIAAVNIDISRASAQEDSWIQVSCFTQNKLSLDYLGLSLRVYENNSVLLTGSTQFEAIGSQPILRIKVDSIGRLTSEKSGTITSDVAFFINASRNYYVGRYYEHYSIHPTIENGVAEYQLDFTDSVETAKTSISEDGNIEDYGIRGRMTFDIWIGNSTGAILQRRFLRVLLQTNADLEVIICSLIVPQTADIKEAKNGEADMKKHLPYWVDTSVPITPLEASSGTLYLEWEMPEEPSLVVKILDDPIMGTIIKSLFSAVLGLLLGRFVWTGISERRQKKRLASKLVMELKRIRSGLRDNKPIITPIYDSSLSTHTLYLLSDETAKCVTEAIQAVRERKDIGYTSLENPESIAKKLREKVNRAINSLQKE